WDRLLIRRGLAALERAGELSGDLGPYTLQAEIAACHARAFTAGETDWVRIADLYARLAALSGSPVVELNRAVALAMAYGPGVGLELVDQIAGEPALKGYHLLPGVRGDLLFRLGRLGEAAAEFERAASLTRNERERVLMERRAASCRRGGGFRVCVAKKGGNGVRGVGAGPHTGFAGSLPHPPLCGCTLRPRERCAVGALAR